MTGNFIDLNCDMGEDFGNYLIGNDEALLQQVSSANIACGFHAGDFAVMHRTVALALKYHVAIGAHPGLPDLQSFGRRNIAITPNEAYQMTLYQVGALAAFIRAAGTDLHHVKPHGALYNMAAEKADLAEAIVNAVADFDRSLILYGLANSKMAEAASKLSIRFAAEAFADRSYTNKGLLTPRSEKGALIESEEASIHQVLSIVQQKSVSASDGSSIQLSADTICIHGDGKHAVSFAQRIREELLVAGVAIQSPQQAR